jgi:hypothetical protein
MDAPAFKCVIKVRSNSMDRILQHITHPSENGTSAMGLPIRETKGKAVLSASFLLLLDVLTEECGGILQVPNVISPDHILKRDRFASSSRAVSTTNKLAADWIPPPPPPLMCEFDLGVCERTGKTGVRYLSVIFWMLIFSFEGLVRMSCERRNDAFIDQEAGRDVETTGVWRTQARHQGSGQETRRCKRPSALTG